ncbi:MAG TPA: hypothetical protein VHJ20_04615 [Polyangia bacterium]|nr:hypothetical protein [Polyangia bacterium]
MSRSTFLTLVAAVAFAVGALAALAPAVLLASKGVAADAAAAVWVREVGVALLGLAVASFGLRRQPDSPGLRAFLLGNLVIQLGLLPIEIAAYRAGVLTRASGIVPNSALHVLLACGFAHFAAKIRVERRSPL